MIVFLSQRECFKRKLFIPVHMKYLSSIECNLFTWGIFVIHSIIKELKGDRLQHKVCPDQIWSPPSLRSNMYRGSCPRCKATWAWGWSSNAKVKNGVAILPLPHTPSRHSAQLIKQGCTYMFRHLIIIFGGICTMNTSVRFSSGLFHNGMHKLL
jgi:hypothetical protein